MQVFTTDSFTEFTALCAEAAEAGRNVRIISHPGGRYAVEVEDAVVQPIGEAGE